MGRRLISLCARCSWSTCPVSCGSGATTRARTISVGAAYGGLSCGPTSEAGACAVPPCPVDCSLTAWTAWALCSDSCSGVSHTRPCSEYDEACCSLGGLRFSQAHVTAYPMVLPSSYSEWLCSNKVCILNRVSLAAGKTKRLRMIMDAPMFGGQLCGR